LASFLNNFIINNAISFFRNRNKMAKVVGRK
jgi:hypothetical protein